MDRKISVKLVNGHYQIYVNGEFKGSCDVGELNETMMDIEEELREEKEFKQRDCKPIPFIV